MWMYMHELHENMELSNSVIQKWLCLVRLVQVTRRGDDPRLGYATPYYWRNKPEMRKYYEQQTEFPTLPGAQNFGQNFAAESEEERDRKLHVVGPRPVLRTRFTQTSLSGDQIRDPAMQVQTPALDAEAQIQSNAGV